MPMMQTRRMLNPHQTLLLLHSRLAITGDATDRVITDSPHSVARYKEALLYTITIFRQTSVT